jgi:hypothetical protein
MYHVCCVAVAVASGCGCGCGCGCLAVAGCGVGRTQDPMAISAIGDWRGWGGSQVPALFLRSKVLKLKPHRECVARPNFLPRRRTRVRLAMLANPVFIFFDGAANDIKLTVFIGPRGRKPSSRHH